MTVRFELVASGSGSTTNLTPYETDPVNLYGQLAGSVAFVVVMMSRTQVGQPAFASSPTVTYNSLAFPICMTEAESAEVTDGNTKYHLSIHQYTNFLIGGQSAPIIITPPETGYTYNIAWMAYRATGCGERPTVYDTTGGTFRLGADDGDLNGTLTFYSDQDQLADGQFVAFYVIPESSPETLGSPWPSSAGIDTLSHGLNRLRCYYNRTTDPATDPTTLLAATTSITSTANAWIYVGLNLLAPDGAAAGALPPRSSAVPFLQANDRYQVIATVDQGTSTTTAEFRYWYANAPSWGEELSGDTAFPTYYALDELGFYNAGSVELPYKVIKVNQEAQVDGILVDFNTRPTEVVHSLATAATVGFTARVEGYGIPDYSRSVSTNSTTGIVASTDRVYEADADEQTGDAAWPNTRTVYMPVHLPQKVRAARVVLTDIHHVEIVRVQLLGKMVTERNV